RDLVVVGFFFSSRRRHTRSKRDWSSDVCSSDLKLPATPQHEEDSEMSSTPHVLSTLRWTSGPNTECSWQCVWTTACFGGCEVGQIGRASCRERVEMTARHSAVKKACGTLERGLA